MREYRDHLTRLELQNTREELSEQDTLAMSKMLIKSLEAIEPGSETATHYHDLMIGVIEFIFYPDLLHPKKEKEIHDGRKRIDIQMENGAVDGILFRLSNNRGIPSGFVSIECKNYSSDVGNAELDQLSGRFSPRRGMFGIQTCRTLESREKYIQRCKDTFGDDRGLIIPLGDKDIIELLELRGMSNFSGIDAYLLNIINEVTA